MSLKYQGALCVVPNGEPVPIAPCRVDADGGVFAATETDRESGKDTVSYRQGDAAMSYTREEIDGLQWADVASSQIEAVAWLSPESALRWGMGDAPWVGVSLGDPRAEWSSAVLLVRFKGGAVYAYAGSADEVVEHFARLIGEESAGRYLSMAIKGRMAYAKLEIEESAT